MLAHRLLQRSYSLDELHVLLSAGSDGIRRVEGRADGDLNAVRVAVEIVPGGGVQVHGATAMMTGDLVRVRPDATLGSLRLGGSEGDVVGLQATVGPRDVLAEAAASGAARDSSSAAAC